VSVATSQILESAARIKNQKQTAATAALGAYLLSSPGSARNSTQARTSSGSAATTAAVAAQGCSCREQTRCSMTKHGGVQVGTLETEACSIWKRATSNAIQNILKNPGESLARGCSIRGSCSVASCKASRINHRYCWVLVPSTRISPRPMTLKFTWQLAIMWHVMEDIST